MAIRGLATAILNKAVRHAAPESRDWGNAMLRELDFVEGDWAALSWAIGSAVCEPAAAPGAGSDQWGLITSRFSIALAAAACAYAQSRAVTAACEGVSRNPGATDTIRLFAIMGLAFIEFLAILTMIVIVMKW